MGRKNLGIVVRMEDVRVSFDEDLEGLSFLVGGICGEIDAGQTRKGLVGYSEEGGCRVVPPVLLCSGSN